MRKRPLHKTSIDAVRAVLVGVDTGLADFPDSMAELALLVESAGTLPVANVIGRRGKTDPALFIGSGKANELKRILEEQDAELAIFNHPLSPSQQRNLERHLGRHVLDRTGLILDIFAQRAQSHVGKTQVELAHVRYRMSRLVRAWSHLERQKGGIGLRGGPGETQMELDRRMLATRAKRLELELAKLQRQQRTQRRSRSRKEVFSVSLVGYTNAGKSTLFNALTKAGAYAADQLFATLDTTSRKMHLHEAGSIVVSDTVGFIRDLPHQLVEAFQATLDETVHADLILHVIDAASLVSREQKAEVEQVLQEIGAADIPRLEIMNKIDLMPETFPHGPIVKRDNNGRPSQIFLSAQAGLGLDLLRSALGEHAQLTDRIRAQDDRAKNHTNATDLVAPLTDRPDSAEFIPIPSRSYSPHNA
ncbi:MAG: GTPase HflX [Burkholderiales bacterium]|nr:GTPase HflX [Burkholderiales bacterium]